MAELLKGPVKWFNDAKGFGFIEHNTGEDVFVHYSVIEWDGFKTLKDGEEVQYELKNGDKGLHAARVIRTDAIKNKVEKSEDSDTEQEIAPNLQSGHITSKYKPSNNMIEMEASEEDNNSRSETELPVEEQTKNI